MRVLGERPDDYESLYGVGLSYAHYAVGGGSHEQRRREYLSKVGHKLHGLYVVSSDVSCLLSIQSLAYLDKASAVRPCSPEPYFIGKFAMYSVEIYLLR